jgi:uncharacterized protein (TIGR03067 family)
MKTAAGILLALSSLTTFAADDGFMPLFNGKDLAGWMGNPVLWSATDGVIHGQTPPSAGDPKKSILTHNSFLVYTNSEFSDFELRFSYKITPNNPDGFANSGVQYRSHVVEQGPFGPIVGGYQADFEAGKTYSGILYEERGRGILAQRGQITILHPNAANPKSPKIEVVGGVGSTTELQANIKSEDWNTYVVYVHGNQTRHIINGRVTSEVLDEDAANAPKTGIIALQLHAGGPMTVEFRDLRIRPLTGAAMSAANLDGDWKGTQLVFNGNPADADFLKDLEMNITGKRFVVTTPDRDMRGSVKIDAGAGTMDVEMDEGDVKKFYAIYELKGDTLRICYGADARPKEYSSEADSNRILAVYKRVTK